MTKNYNEVSAAGYHLNPELKIEYVFSCMGVIA